MTEKPDLAARLSRGLLPSPPPPPSTTAAPLMLGETFAGVIAAVVVLSYCLSYSSVLFAGPLKAEAPTALWALMMGAVVAGGIIAAASMMPPVASGPDTAGMAMLSVIAGHVAEQVFAAGGSSEQAAAHVLLSLALATAAVGAMMLVLGVTRTANYVRFVPYPVAAGYICAAGFLMIISSIRVVVGHKFDVGDILYGNSDASIGKLIVTGVIAVIFVVGRAWIASSFTVPIIFAGATISLDALLWWGPLQSERAAWFAEPIQSVAAWSPLITLAEPFLNWSILAHAIPDIIAFAGVMAVSLMIKITNIEISTARAVDLDHEFRWTGAANIVSALFGGFGGSVMTTPSRVLVDAGGARWPSGLICALVVGLVLLTRIDLNVLVPTPVLSGLLIYFGWISLIETLGRPSAQMTWVELLLVGAIIVTCAMFGYSTGGLLGFVLSCVLFVFRYSTIGVVRREATRANMTSTVERSPEEERYLRDNGDTIRIFWLTGYVFFGSSDALFERVRASIEKQSARPIRAVVLDFSGVTGLDLSARKSLAKLTVFCDSRGVVIAYSGLSPSYVVILERSRVLGVRTPHRAFASRNEAIEWCEEKLIAEERATLAGIRPVPFEQWLADGLAIPDPEPVLAYFERRVIPGGSILYRQDAPSDTIELVSSGSISITLNDHDGRRIRVRRMGQKTVVGEMGFFGGTPRRANVETEAEAVVYTMTRTSYQRMLAQHPDLANTFLEFIIRTLAERVAYANAEILVLS